MINRLLFNFSSRLPCRLITVNDNPYLERYYMGKLFGFTFYLHRFVSSDSEKHIHNHPWKHGGSIILSGGYIEERLVDLCPSVSASGCATRKIKRLFFNVVNGNTFHRITYARPKTWTLFFHNSRSVLRDEKYHSTYKGWGFLSREYVVGHHEVTMFKPYDTSNTMNWWETAPTGKNSKRLPL